MIDLAFLSGLDVHGLSAVQHPTAGVEAPQLAHGEYYSMHNAGDW